MAKIEHQGKITIDTIQNYHKDSACWVEFSNGCIIGFHDDYIGGDTPYGVNSLFVNDQNYQTVIDWLKYWNEDRTETGQLISDI